MIFPLLTLSPPKARASCECTSSGPWCSLARSDVLRARDLPAQLLAPEAAPTSARARVLTGIGIVASRGATEAAANGAIRHRRNPCDKGD
jgi:hypothetical protein